MAKAKTVKPRVTTVGKRPGPDEGLDWRLDDGRRMQVKADAAALGAELVERPRSYLRERIAWMATLLECAWRDRARLVGIELDGQALSVAELREFGWRIALVRELVEQWQLGRMDTPEAVVPGALKAPAEMTLQALRDEQRAIQRKLLSAFDMRFRQNPEGRRKLQQIRRGNGDPDIASDALELLTLCASEAHRDWLRALPKGEAAAASRLGLLAPEFRARSARPEVTSAERIDLGALRDRAWTLASHTADRVRGVGRYIFSEDPARKRDYAAFKAPRTRKRTKGP